MTRHAAPTHSADALFRRRLGYAGEVLRNIVWTNRTPSPVCDCCGQLRNDESYWLAVEGRLTATRAAQWCPNCSRTRADDDLEVSAVLPGPAA